MSTQDQDVYFDPDDVGPNRSPLLIPVQPKYRHEDTPPPYVPEETPSSSCSPESPKDGAGPADQDGGASVAERKKKRKGRRQAPAFADGVLINALDPNQPEIARLAELDPLEKDWEEEDDDPVDSHMSKTDEERHDDANHVDPKQAADVASQALAVDVDEDEDFVLRDVDMVAPVREKGPIKPPATNEVLHNGHTPANQEPSELRSQPEKKMFDVKPPPRLPHSLPPLSTDPSKSISHRVYDREDSLATSPNLAKFTISEAEGNPDSTLPAMQMSPPRSCSGQSPESQQTLPSLQTALSMESNGSGSATFSLPGHSPTLTRPSPGHVSQFGQSPSSYSQSAPNMSPPGPPAHPGYWRGPREGSMSTPSDYHSTPTSHTTMTPSSTTSYTPSIATVAEHNLNHHRQDSLDGSNSAASPQSQGQLLNGPVQPNGPFATNSFKCTFQGCTALPFQTQYLLNSHANVHSHSRPHFCPVPECPRGPGGKGFKRKNEMIRHGLVHDSPGYVCPFCPDQQHKYPRPDNLQRHVRVHHVDKDRDDPMLRHVLAQRPEGGNRGRRRRGGSTG